MSLSMMELAQAREITGGLLNELGLETYLFEIEPGEDYWQVRLECALKPDGGWETTILPVTKDILLASRGNATVHENILDIWRKQLTACKLLKTSKAAPGNNSHA